MTSNPSEQILHQAYALFSQILPVKEAWLYGSYARGDYDNESDVDILLNICLPPEELKHFRKTAAEIVSKLSLAYDVTVSVAMKSSAEMEKYSGFVPYYQNVLREGRRYAG